MEQNRRKDMQDLRGLSRSPLLSYMQKAIAAAGAAP
jgi:hypothetical protein